MVRALWALGALVAGLFGWYLRLEAGDGPVGWLGWISIGVGVGIATAVLGSLAHDALAGSRERL